MLSSILTTGAFTGTQFLICTGASLVLGILCALVYMYKNDRYNKNFVITLALMPAIVQMVIMLVNGNIGTGVAVMALVAPAGNDNALQYYMVGGWNQMKAEAEKNGSVTHQGIVLTSDFFKEIESYDPCDYGYKFGDKPVLVIYNTLDHVVLPETSLECANAYKNVTKIKITSNGGHGYEMGYKHSKVKDMLIGRIRDFFLANL